MLGVRIPPEEPFFPCLIASAPRTPFDGGGRDVPRSSTTTSEGHGDRGASPRRGRISSRHSPREGHQPALGCDVPQYGGGFGAGMPSGGDVPRSPWPSEGVVHDLERPHRLRREGGGAVSAS